MGSYRVKVGHIPTPQLTVGSYTYSTVNLSWSLPKAYVKLVNYILERDGTPIYTGTNTTYQDTNRTPETTYVYRVRLIDTSGRYSSYSTSRSVTTQALVDTEAPVIGGLYTSNVTSNSITLTWDAATDNVGVTGYRLEWSGDGSTYQLLYSGPNLTYQHTSLDSGVLYYYRVNARDAANNTSDWSATASARTSTSQTTAWPAQGPPTIGGVYYTPIVRNLRGPGVNTPAGSGRTINTIHQPGDVLSKPSVIRVVNSLASTLTTGTLRQAIFDHNNDPQARPSTIVFDVGGRIDMGGTLLRIDKPNLTIAGETAPAPGIEIVRGRLYPYSRDVKISHIAIRGLENLQDSMAIYNGRINNVDIGPRTFGTPDADMRVVIDHCAIQWGGDEILSTVSTEAQITIASSIIAEPVGYGNPTDPLDAHIAHQYNGIIGHAGTDYILTTRSVFHTATRRSPRCGTKRSALVNNLFYNWIGALTELFASSNPPQYLTYVGNYCKSGPIQNGSKPVTTSGLAASARIYYSDNIWNRTSGTLTTIADLVSNITEEGAATYWPEGLVQATATNTYSLVLYDVGPRPAERRARVTNQYDIEMARLTDHIEARTHDPKMLANADGLNLTEIFPGSRIFGLADSTPLASTQATPGRWTAPPSGGNWHDIVVTADGNYTKLEAYIHELENALL